MKTRTVVITAANGLHARPAGELVNMIKGMESRVTLRTEAREAEARSILSILSLGLKCGTAVTVTADGPEEERAVEQVASFLQQTHE
jgi:phosphotransferase system HPr (HPr) family protein